MKFQVESGYEKIYQSASRNSSLHISDEKPLEGFQFKIKYVGDNTVINIIICQNMILMTNMFNSTECQIQ